MIADIFVVMGVMVAGLVLGWWGRGRWDREDYLPDQSEMPAEGCRCCSDEDYGACTCSRDCGNIRCTGGWHASDELLPELPDWDDATLGALRDERTDDATVLYLPEENVAAGEETRDAGMAASAPVLFAHNAPVLTARTGTGRRDRRDWHKRRGPYSRGAELVFSASGVSLSLPGPVSSATVPGRAGEFHSREERVITLKEAEARAAAWLAADEFAVWEAGMAGLINGAWEWFYGAGRWEIAA
jgi:hypothetical protein